jgi:uncharacterized protein (UPF0262 family)
MPVAAIRIQDRSWETASAARRQEWRALIADLLAHEAPWPSRPACDLTIAWDDEELRLTFASAGGIETTRLARADFDKVLSEYLGIIKRLGDEDLPMAQAEAIDMAKRVVHDDAGRRMGVLLPELSDRLEVQRRFFSLVVATIGGSSGRAHLHL